MYFHNSMWKNLNLPMERKNKFSYHVKSIKESVPTYPHICNLDHSQNLKYFFLIPA